MALLFADLRAAERLTALLRHALVAASAPLATSAASAVAATAASAVATTAASAVAATTTAATTAVSAATRAATKAATIAAPVAALAMVVAPAIRTELAAAAPRLITRAVHTAVDAVKPALVAPLYTDDDLVEPTELCAALDVPERRVAHDEYSPSEEAVERIRDTLALVVGVTPFEARACALTTLVGRVAALATVIPDVELWLHADLVMYLAVAFRDDVAWVPAHTVRAIRAALLELVEAGARAAEPAPAATGVFGAISSYLLGAPAAKPALALRQCEVAMRALGADAAAHAAFVAHVRARTWAEWVAGKLPLADTRFFGYDFIELPGVKGIAPHRIPLAADKTEPSASWAVDLATSAAAALYPNAYAQASRIHALAVETAPRIRFAGFEPPGVGLALHRASETRGMLEQYDRRYAPALGAVARYAARLLGQTDNGAVDGLLAKMRAPKAAPKRDAEPRRALRTCVDARADARLRTGAYWRWCTQSEREAARRGAAVEGVRAAGTVEQLFAILDDVELLPKPNREEYQRKVESAVAVEAAQLRRIEVMRTRLSLHAESAGPALFEHISANANAGKPHGLAVHELGCEHTVVLVGRTAAHRTLFTPGALDASLRKRAGQWLAATFAPGAAELATALLAETGRSVQYAGREPPGVGYALSVLLPVLDDASPRADHAFVRDATLEAVRELLSL
jgi:hypothetical protein